MKVLFISYIEVEGKSDFGGAQASIRNYNGLLRNNSVDKYIVKKKSTVKSILSLCQMKMAPLRLEDENTILKNIEKNSYDCVWVDSSMMGSLVKKIKIHYPKVQVYTFFHNVEYDYVKVRIGNRIKQLVYSFIAKKEEKKSVLYSDNRVVLSERDIMRLEELYGKIEFDVLPITFSDSFNLDKVHEYNHNGSDVIGLFVGAYGRSNYEGLMWFIRKIKLPSNVEIQVVGKNFENHREEIENVNQQARVKVIGSVDNIDEYYYKADFVIIPILFGAGMKVKTAEALMYGKTIFGTKEAFAGYCIDYNRVGCCSDDIDELEERIIDFVNNKANSFNEYSRKVFLQKYSNKVSDLFFDGIK